MTTAEEHLGNLLAYIHRDGGHYQDKYGTDKAVEDAIQIVAKNNALMDENKLLKEDAKYWYHFSDVESGLFAGLYMKDIIDQVALHKSLVK